MSININACKTAIIQVKSNINECFKACDEKGSTYQQSANTTSELIQKIKGISGGSANPSINMNAQSCGHFNVTWAQIEDPTDIPQQFTVDFGSFGTTFKSVMIYSATRDGYFSVTKIDSTKCVVSAHPFILYDDESIYGVTDLGQGTYRANYVINGSSITFTRANYENDGVNYPGVKDDNFRNLPSQIAPVEVYPGSIQADYLLELINVIV